jgi:acrylyl-CoA reductase (NADPH)
VVRAFVVSEVDDILSTGVREVEPVASDQNDVLVAVDFSGVNFKDAMVATPRSRVRRVATLVGGVDAAGTVLHTSDPALPVGARVAVHGGALGVARDGGFAELIHSPAHYVTALPDSISTRVAMIIGTAGFTAMESLLALEDRGLEEGSEVLVTGATGGVGSHAVSLLAAKGYRPVASTGSPASSEWLLARGAVRVIGRDEVADKPERVLASETWAGAIDCVGGDTLAQILRSLRYGAAVAASGLVASAELATTVYPFITRSVALLGIDSVEATKATRERVWCAIGEIVDTIDFEALVDREVPLEELPSALDTIRDGKTRGRILVNPAPG